MYEAQCAQCAKKYFVESEDKVVNSAYGEICSKACLDKLSSWVLDATSDDFQDEGILKVFTVRFGGVVIGDTMILVEKDAETAYQKAVEELKRRDLWYDHNDKYFTIKDIIEVETDRPQVILMGTGNM